MPSSILAQRDRRLNLCSQSMKIGERGQVTIPKEIRDRFGLGPDTHVEFRVLNGSIVLYRAEKGSEKTEPPKVEGPLPRELL